MKLSSFHEKRYGSWAGNPAGKKADPERCCVQVQEPGRGGLFHQCYKKRGHGPEQAYCSQHNPEKVEARRAEQDRKFKEELRHRSLQWAGPEFYKVLKQIADGHNDPRSLAKKAIKEYSR